MERRLPRLYGRDNALDLLCRQVRDRDIRLLTLVGPGGVGKTTMAREILRRAEDAFRDGTEVVSLEGTGYVSGLDTSLAAALQLDQFTAQTAVEALVHHVGSRDLLLLLDNLEQFEMDVGVIGTLLRANPNLTILATSRSRLRLSNEYVFDVPPLQLPSEATHVSLDSALASDAVRLFLDRAQAIKPAFDLTVENAAIIAQLCRRLDGLPLAIELAAAQLAVFSPGELLLRLTRGQPMIVEGPIDQPSRHRSLEAVVDSSYRALPHDQQHLLQRLVVFVGGFTAQAAQAVCQTEASADELLVMLSVLVERHLVIRHGHQDHDVGPQVRFALLETVRAYLMDRLRESGDVEHVFRAHAEYYLRYAESLSPIVVGLHQAELLGDLAREEGNISAALQWFGDGRGEQALRLATAMGWFWAARGRLREGRDWLERAADIAVEPPPWLLARTKRVLGLIIFLQGDPATCQLLYTESLALYDALGDLPRLADALNALAALAAVRHDFDQAEAYGLRGADVARLVQDTRVRAFLLTANLSNLGVAELEKGHVAVARDHFDDAVRQFRAQANTWGCLRSLFLAARTRRILGDKQGALEAYRECLIIADADGDLRMQEAVVASIGCTLVSAGHVAAGVTLFGIAAKLATLMGAPPFSYSLDRADISRDRQKARIVLGSTTYDQAFSDGTETSPDAILPIVLDLIDAASLPATASQTRVVLTPRERDVLHGIVQGLTDQQIADSHFLSRRTVQNHIARLFAKLGASSRTGAATTAIRMGIISSDQMP